MRVLLLILDHGLSCESFQDQFPWLECDGDQFAPVQCIEEDECFCIDPHTGLRIGGRSRPWEDVNCDGKVILELQLYYNAWLASMYMHGSCMYNVYTT